MNVLLVNITDIRGLILCIVADTHWQGDCLVSPLEFLEFFLFIWDYMDKAFSGGFWVMWSQRGTKSCACSKYFPFPNTYHLAGKVRNVPNTTLKTWWEESSFGWNNASCARLLVFCFLFYQNNQIGKTTGDRSGEDCQLKLCLSIPRRICENAILSPILYS